MSTTTTSIWRAAYFIARGLQLVRAEPQGPAGCVKFRFSDPHGDARRLTEQFLHDVELQRVITSRGVLSEVLDVVREHGQCAPGDIAAALRRVGAPWDRRAEPSGDEKESS